MAEEHRLAFHEASGLDDWRMLYCGPTAHFACASLREAAGFASAVVALPELAGAAPFLDVRSSGVIVRLVADLWDLGDDVDAVAAARAVSTLARDRGLAPRPELLQDVQLAISAVDPAEVLPFWRALLGYVDHAGDDLVDPRGRGPSLWFQRLDPAKPLRHAMHVDVAVPRDLVSTRVRAAVRAGGRIADDAVAPRWWTIADPAGNKADLVAWPDLPIAEGEDEISELAAHARPGAAVDRADDAGPHRVPGDPAVGEAVWELFRTADGVEDWPVVFSGPTAFFRTGSVAASADLARRIAEVARPTALLDLCADGVTVRLSADFTLLHADDLDAARRISAVAREHGASADPSQVQAMQIAVSSRPDDAVRPVWRDLLGYDELGEEDLVDRVGRGPAFWFQELDAGKALRHAFHLDLSVPRAVGRARVDAALAAGGRIADDRSPNWWTLADPAGNKVDVAIWADRADAADAAGAAGD